MIRTILCIWCALVVSYTQAQNVVDSMDYGNNTMEWRSFITDEPAVAFAEAKGMVWYATASGVGAYSVKTNVKNVVMNLGDFSTQGVTCMAADTRGGVWIGTGEGIAHTTDGKTFSTFAKKDGLAGDAVTALHVAGDGTVWVGTKNGASSYGGGSWSTYTTANGLCGNSVRDIASGGGKVFFATGAGIAVYSGGKWSKHDKNSGLNSNNVRAVAWDDRRQLLWAAVGESDVNSFNGKEWDDFMEVQKGITCIMVDTQSRVWVGSESGIIKYNGFEWIYDASKMPFPATMCNTMHRDEGGNLWFAIETGVMRLANPYPY